MQGCALRALCAGDAREPTATKETKRKYFRRSVRTWWAWLDLNQRPHPYQVSRAKRCADRRFPRSPPSVRGEGMRSNSPPGSAQTQCRGRRQGMRATGIRQGDGAAGWARQPHQLADRGGVRQPVGAGLSDLLAWRQARRTAPERRPVQPATRAANGAARPARLKGSVRSPGDARTPRSSLWWAAVVDDHGSASALAWAAAVMPARLVPPVGPRAPGPAQASPSTCLPPIDRG